MKSTVLRLYNLLIHILLPGVLIRLFWRARKNPGYKLRIGERFGFYSQSYRPEGLVVHAVSVGETVAAQPLIERLLEAYPDLPITVTSTTPTGSARVQNLFGSRVQHVYLPYDYPWALKRFFKTFKPKNLILMETEWWPNLFFTAHKQGVHLMMANARLSERSVKGYLKIASLAKRMALCLKKVCAQTHEDAERFKSLGVPDLRVEVTGNIKFDLQIDDLMRERAAKLKASFEGRPVWIAASTHAGEEALVIQTIQQVLVDYPQALTIIVPRHPERFAAFYQSLVQAGLQVTRRSQNEKPSEYTQVYLGDTMGELTLLYGAAEIAFVAGSFVPAGGHNMLEAALMGCAIVMGPHLENVSTQTAQLILKRGMVLVESPEALAQAIIHWFQDPKDRASYVTQATEFMRINQGAADRTFYSLTRSFPMKIGIIGAMEEEVKILRELLTHCKHQMIGHSEFITGVLGSTHIVLVRSHQGKVNAAMAATILLQVFRPDYVINTGSAGGMRPECKVGDLTVPEALTYHDADTRILGYELGQIPDMPKEYHACPKLIEAVMKAAAEHPELVMRHGLHATGDSFMAGDEQLALLLRNFPNLMSVDMEATAIAQICTTYEVPFVIIRALSDIVGQDNHIDFHEFLPLASHNSSMLVVSFVRVLEREMSALSA